MLSGYKSSHTSLQVDRIGYKIVSVAFHKIYISKKSKQFLFLHIEIWELVLNLTRYDSSPDLSQHVPCLQVQSKTDQIV